MDTEVKFYLERFKKEEENLAEAVRNRMEWNEKEARANTKMRALLQLLTDQAQEVGERLPDDVIAKATSILGPNVHAMFKDMKARTESSGESSEISPDGSLALRENPEKLEGNRVEWIARAISASGSIGMTPPEVWRKAKDSGLTMHPNYPYVVLGKLVERKVVDKKGSRYYSKTK